MEYLSKLLEIQEKNESLVAKTLGKQVLELLKTAGIKNLRANDDGKIRGETTKLHVYPTTTYLDNIRLEVEDGNIIINAEITGTSENIGSVI